MAIAAVVLGVSVVGVSFAGVLFSSDLRLSPKARGLLDAISAAQAAATAKLRCA